MGYRISNDCKALRHAVLLGFFLLIGIGVLHTSFAASKSINVYLKLKPQNRIANLIRNFNQFLEEHQLFSTYQLTAFNKKYPLHATLYLTEYNPQKIPAIVQHVEGMAKYQRIIPIKSVDFTANNSGYVMLTIRPSNELRILSDVAVDTLAYMRNKKAKIPGWAAQDPARQELFKQFGSPNVRDYFNPHFSVFDPDHLSKKEQAELYQQLQKLIGQFKATHSTQLEANANALAVGIANSQGQIIKEIASFPLN